MKQTLHPCKGRARTPRVLTPGLWRGDMNKTIFSTPLFLLIFASAGFTSEINRITLSELHAQADLIVMAEVTELVEEGNQDHVSIEADVFLKGESPQTVFTFTLVTRGGLKDFDPSLKKGDTGVFFLKLKEQEGQVEKAYWGSIATFQKNHFDLTELKPETNTFTVINLATSLDAWRSYRVKSGQARNIKEYERGFRKGFTGPPGLVDGSADFNLGHSDGMLAKLKKFPGQKDEGDGK